MSFDDRDKSRLAQRKSQTDSTLAERHDGWDRAAQDLTPKYARPHFAVVGEGSKTANRAYQDNYALIDWKA